MSLLAPEDVPPEVALWFDHRKRRFATQNLADQTTIHFADSPSVLLLRWGEVLALRGPGRTPDDVLWATPGVGEQYGWQVQETGSEARIVPFDTYYPQHK